MKKLVLITACMIWRMVCAQPIAVVSNAKMNVLYVGLDNPLSLVSTVKYDSVYMKSEHSTEIIYLQNTVYSVKPKEPGLMEIGLYSGGKVIFSQPFRVKMIPKPTLYLGGNSSQLSRLSLLACYGIASNAENFDYQINWQVISYEIILNSNDKVFAFKGSGNQLTNEFKVFAKENLFEIMFIDAKVKGPDGSIHHVSSKFKILN